MRLTGCAAQHSERPSIEDVRPAIPPISIPARFVPQKPLDNYVAGVENFGFVSADVWRGARPTPEGLQTLAAMGVKAVIDLEQTDVPADVPSGVTLVRLPVSGWRAHQVDVEGVLRAIDHSPKPVFVHCKQGRDRTGLAIAAYRLSQGMTADDAITELRNFHVNVWWLLPIESRIRELEKTASGEAHK